MNKMFRLSPAIGILAFIGLLVYWSIGLLTPSPASAACYCQDPSVCRCSTAPPASARNETAIGGIAVVCDTPEEANSVFAIKAPICGSSPEIVPACAPNKALPSEYTCYGAGFATGASTVPPEAFSGLTRVNGLKFNGVDYPDARSVLACNSIAFCCARSDIQCDDTKVPTTPSSCPDQNPSVTPPVGICGITGGGTPAPVYSSGPPPDYPPPGTLCNQYEYKNEPHPLRPAPALPCENVVPRPFNLSCANDVLPSLTVYRPRGTSNPGDSLNATTTCSSAGSCRLNCHRDETLTEAIIGPVNITIDLTSLELPIAGIASRNCETGRCDVDIPGPAGTPLLSDGLKMRNYTSWFPQGAIEQAEEEPLDYYDPGPTLKRSLEYAGPLKKLIPAEVLDAERLELIQEALAGRTYNQIVGYVDGNRVVGRREARARGLTGPGHVIRLTDMINHVAPAWDPHASDGNKWYYLWKQVPFTGKEDPDRTPHFSGHIDTLGEVFPTACLRSLGDPRRCQSDPKVLDAVLTAVQSGIDSFLVYPPHQVEDDTLLMSLLQAALIPAEPDVPHTDGRPDFPLLTEANLQEEIRQPEWTINADGSYRNADGCRIQNALWNPGDSLEAKRNKKGGIINATATFKREVSYDYQVSLPCDFPPITGRVPVPVQAPVPVHLRLSHMDEIGDRTVAGKGAIFKALYPDIKNTIGEIINRPAESTLRYLCRNTNWGCKANSTSHKGSPMAFFPWWGETLELFHLKIQCMLDPLRRPCVNAAAALVPPGSGQPPAGTPPGQPPAGAPPGQPPIGGPPGQPPGSPPGSPPATTYCSGIRNPAGAAIGACLPRAQCNFGCQIAGPQEGWADCTTSGYVCCDVVTPSQCSNPNSQSCAFWGGVCTPGNIDSCGVDSQGRNCRIPPQEGKPWTDCRSGQEVCCRQNCR